MNKLHLEDARKLVAKVGEIMLQRNLTDLSGGNISMRIGNEIVMSPKYAGTMRFWQIKPEEVLVLDLAGNKIEGKGEVSREAPSHLVLLNHFYPTGQAVIHAHPRNTMVFCVAQQPIIPVTEGSVKFGEIRMAKFADGGSYNEKLATNVLAEFIGQEELIAKQAAVVLAPWHGVFAVGKNLQSTLDAIERVENNAYCILMSKLLLSNTDSLENHRQALITAVKEAKGESSE
jgi:L-fuculose-phosphate aldolase